MKRLVSLLVVGALIIGVLGAPTTIGENNEKAGDSSCSFYEDELDQSQPDQTEDWGMPVGNIHIEEIELYIQVAQSFIPTMEVLTRVEIFIGKNSTATHPYVVAIRDNLTEDNIVETSVDPEDIVTENFSWIEFDFDDIWVTPGQTYYIVSYTENISNNWFAWGVNNDSESYPNGCMWTSIDEGDTWGNESAELNLNQGEVGTLGAVPQNVTWDMCFKTYGLEETVLEIELTSGLLGPSVIIRNIGDETAWDVEWSITIEGGLLGFINKTVEGTYDELSPGEEITVQIGLILGFGQIEISARAWAANAQEVSTMVNAFLILFFILIR